MLVDLIGDDPDPVIDRPPTDGLDLAGRVDGSGRVGRRHEQQHLGACGPSRLQPVHGDLEPLLPGRRHLDRDSSRQPDDLRIGGPVGRRQQDLVAGIEQGGEGLFDRLLAAVGDEHLGGGHLEARVPGGLGGHRRPQLRQAGGGRVPVIPRVGARRHRSGHDVRRCREVRLARRRNRSRPRRRRRGPWPWRRWPASPIRPRRQCAVRFEPLAAIVSQWPRPLPAISRSLPACCPPTDASAPGRPRCRRRRSPLCRSSVPPCSAPATARPR